MSQFLRSSYTKAEVDAVAAAAASVAAAAAQAAAQAFATAAAQTTPVEGKTRTVPAAFSWAGIVPKVCQGVGNASASEGVSAYARRVHSALIGVGECWVDPVNGLDANAGTVTAPVKTLSHACKNIGPSLVLCVAGTYAPFDFRNTDAQGAKLKILRAMGACTIANAADDATAATWTADGTFPNVWWMPLTPANKPVRVVLDSSRLDEEGLPVPLARYVDVTTTNASGLGYFHDVAANRLYVRYQTSSVNTAGIKSRLRIVTGDATTKVMALGSKMLFEGDWTMEGVFLQPLQNAGVRAYLYGDFAGKRPTVAYTVSHAMDSLGADSYLRKAWAHRPQGDGWHYTDSGGLASNGVEVDCTATYAGNIAGEPTSPNTSNGSTTHLACNVLRINGRYARSWGPDIVDTGTGASWNVGTIAGPGAPSGNAFGLYTTGPAMLLDCCESQGHDAADVATTAGGTIQKFATSYSTTSTAGGGGSITEYVP